MAHLALLQHKSDGFQQRDSDWIGMSASVILVIGESLPLGPDYIVRFAEQTHYSKFPYNPKINL